jgi:hypothetical protein
VINAPTSPTMMLNQHRYRPMGVSDLFDEAFDLYKSNFLLFLGASAIAYVPLQAVLLYFLTPSLNAWGQESQSSNVGFDQAMQFLSRQFVSYSSIFAVYSVLYVIFSAPTVFVIGQRYLGRDVTIGQAYFEAIRRAFSVIVGVIVAGIPIAIGSAFCLFPGMAVLCRWLCLPQVLVLERRMSPFAAIARANRLGREQFWRCAGVLTMLSFVSIAISLAFEAVLYLLLTFVPLGSLPGLGDTATQMNIANQVAGTVSTLLVTPFMWAVLTVVYYDIRIRQEGYDMEIIAEQLGLEIRRDAVAMPSATAPLGPAKRRFWQRPRKGAKS